MPRRRSINTAEQRPDLTYQSIIKRLAIHHFQVKALIQKRVERGSVALQSTFCNDCDMKDILACRESMDALSQLNELGRCKITALREEIEVLETYARETSEEKILMEVESQRHQLAGTLKSFREANILSLFAIEKAEREELLNPLDSDDVAVRNRKKMDKSGLLKMSTGVTDQLLSISRHLADTTQRSQYTLDNLVSSSSTVHGTQSELQNTAGSISQSSKLLKKYGRREFTDKVIMFFAFLFFIAVVLYIIQKRLF